MSGAHRPRSGTARHEAAVAALCAVQFVDVLSTTTVIAALPAMLSDLGATPSAAALVVPVYSVFFGALLMLGARLGDRRGHRRALQLGLLLFAGASASAALAPSILVLVLARGALGAAAALSVPPALRLLSAASPAEDARRRALAAWSAAGAAAGASGLVLGGVLSDAAGWRVMFWLNVPLAGALLAAVRSSSPEVPPDAGGPLDGAGACTLALAVAGLVVGASLLESPTGRVTGGLVLVAALAGLAAFARVERRAADPLLPAAAARSAALRTGAATSFANTATTSSAVTLTTLHLQDIRGLSPTAAGLTLLPFSLLVVLGAALSTRFMQATAPRTAAAAGLAVIALGNALLLASSAGTWTTSVAVGVSGLGIGLASVAATTLGTTVPEFLQGSAAGVLNTAAQLGTALGVAAILVVAGATQNATFPLAGTSSGLLAASLAAAVAAVALLVRRRS